MTLQPGTAVGRYQILEPLGQGGMATVYKAFQPSLQREVALKVLRPGYAQDEEFRGRFEREAIAIAKLRHPHIVQVFDFEVAASGEYVLAMEFLEGGTLKDRLTALAGEGHGMDPEQSVRIVAEVAEALSYAHEKGIVHRDVKPSNVMLTHKDRAVVTDFGIARILGATSHTQTGVGIGTPEYMAPEQGQGSAIDHRADIYSLGAMAYELFTGRVPYSADTPLAVVLAHIKDPLPLPSKANPTIGKSVERALLKALAKDPAQRFDSATAFAEALKSGLAEDTRGGTMPTVAVRAGGAAPAAGVRASAAPARAVTVPLPPILAQRPVQLSIAGALVLAIVVSGVGFAVTRSTGEPVSSSGPTSIDPIPKGALYYEARLDGTQSFIRPGSVRKNARGGATTKDPDAVALRTTVGTIEIANVKPLSHIEFAFDAPVRQNYVVELDVQAPEGGKAVAELYLRTGTGGMYWLNISPDGGSAVNHNPGGPPTLTQRIGERFFLPPLTGARAVALAIVVEDARFTIFADGRQYAQVDASRVVSSAQPLVISNYSTTADATGALRITRAQFFELDKAKAASLAAATAQPTSGTPPPFVTATPVAPAPIPRGPLVWEAKLDGGATKDIGSQDVGPAGAKVTDAEIRQLKGAIEIETRTAPYGAGFFPNTPVRNTYVYEIDGVAPTGTLTIYPRNGSNQGYPRVGIRVASGAITITYQPSSSAAIEDLAPPRAADMVAGRPFSLAVVVEDTRYMVFVGDKLVTQAVEARIQGAYLPRIFYSGAVGAVLRITGLRMYEVRSP